MSTQLVEQRRQRINLMRGLANNKTVEQLQKGTEDPWIPKESFLARCSTMVLFVRMKVCHEYYKGLVDAGVFEENENGSLFRSVEAIQNYKKQTEKQATLESEKST